MASATSGTRFRKLFRSVIHSLSYRFIYDQRRTRRTRAAGFSLVVRPTVFHPRWFLTSEFFAGFLGTLDLSGQRVVDVGTGSGAVLAVDINPNAAQSASENARAHGLGDRVSAVCSDLLSGVAPKPLFDLVLSSPPSFAGEPLDVADRAWHAGPNYRDIAALFEQARERLVPGGRMLLLLSSDSDLDLMNELAGAAGFVSRLIATRSIVMESFLLYELLSDAAQRSDELPSSAGRVSAR
jgi:release factor glutamine methyltransferase